MCPLPTDTSRESEPIRLFKSDFLEFFTHISPITILVLWVPVTILLLIYSAPTVPGFPWSIPLGIVIGLALWTFAEYTLHRFVFHYHARSRNRSASSFCSTASITLSPR